MAVSVKEQRERRRPSRPPYSVDFLKWHFKVKPCSVEGCHQDPARCPYLHRGEEGRRDPRCFFYDATPCAEYHRNGRWCSRGHGCKHTHGFLERRLHPYRHLNWNEEALEFVDLEAHLKEEDRLSRRAPERAAIQCILDAKNRAGRMHPLIAPVTISSLHELAMASDDAVDACYKQYRPGASDIDLSDTTVIYGSSRVAALGRNVWNICRAPFDDAKEGILNCIKGVIASTFIQEQERSSGGTLSSYIVRFFKLAYLLVGARWSSGHALNTDPAEDFNVPFELDSGASVHAVGKDTMLNDYSRLEIPRRVEIPNGKFLKVAGLGTLKWGPFLIPNVRHVKGLKGILISVGQLDRDHKLYTSFGGGTCVITQADGTTVGEGCMGERGMYVLASLCVPEHAQEWPNARFARRR